MCKHHVARRAGPAGLLIFAAGIVAAIGCSDDSGTTTDGLKAASVCSPAGTAQQVVDVASDGSRMAYLVCDNGVSVWTRALDAAAGEPVRIAAASKGTTVEFLLDNRHLLYNVGGQWFVGAVDGSSAVAPLGNDILQTRPFLERVSSTAFEPRLLVLQGAGATKKKISVRAVEDDYLSPKTLLESTELSGDLSHLSASGRTLVTQTGDGAAARFVKLRTNSSKKTVELSFGPGELAMAPVGLGDTHNFAFSEDALVRVELESGKRVELIARAALIDETALFEREDAPGRKYAHFIVDGNPSRRIRDATEPLEILAEANATYQALSKDNETIVYLSDGKLWAVPAIGGGTPKEVIGEVGQSTEVVLVFSPDSSEVALRIAGGGLLRAPLDGGQPAELVEQEGVHAKSIGYNDAGTHLLWISSADGVSGELRSAPLGGGSARTVATGTSAWLPIPGSSEVLSRGGGVLARVEP